MNKFTFAVMSLVLAGSLHAQEVIDYQGAPYTSTHTVFRPNSMGVNTIVPTYSLGQAISGSITLASALSPNMDDVALIPTSLSFSDGNLVMTLGRGGAFELTNAPGTSGSPDVFHFWTNPSGQITNWQFSLYGITSGTNSPEAVTISSAPAGDHSTFTQFSNSGASATAFADTSEAGGWFDSSGNKISAVTEGVPEINGASAAGAVTLLLGCLAVIGARRHLQIG